MSFAQSPFIRSTLRGELACLEIRHPLFSADLLLQGAQLLHFAPAGDSNWLWLSEQASYRRGQSVRGGIPVCWPWFGNAAKNPAAVQDNIPQPHKAPAHGFARARTWTPAQCYEAADRVELTLTLEECTDENWLPALQPRIQFVFSAAALNISLITRNNSAHTVTFSQALHTYFPAQDIREVRIDGLQNSRYIDTLENWQEKKQQGSVTFSAETDRIYYPAGALRLITPVRTLTLETQGSHSAVVWNPWIHKSLTLSQFASDAWQRMFCVETANAADDAISLPAGQEHCLQLTLSR